MNKCYCIYCKSENDKKSKTCRVCNRKLKPIDELYLNYLKDNAKDKVSGDILDNVTDFITSFIKKHLYGIIMSITIVSVVTGNVIVNNNLNETIIPNEKLVSEKPVLAVSNYTDYKVLVNDFLTSLSNLESIDKYYYKTYFNEEISNDLTNNIIDMYKKINGYNHMEEFNQMVFYVEDTKKPEFKDISGIDVSLYDDFKVFSFSVSECKSNVCGINNVKDYREVSIEELNSYYFISFVKKNGYWYYYKTSEHMYEGGGTDFGGFIIDNQVYDYDAAWEREDNL